MRFDSSKAWPHPVLRPPRYGDDYPQAEFEVEIRLTRGQGSTEVEVQVEFQLSEPDLLRLVNEGLGQYVLLIKASRTHFRELIGSDGVQIQKHYPAGALAGRVEFSPFLVCTQDLRGFSCAGWHPDYRGRTFDIAAGSVLAEDEPKDYWVDTADEAPLGSIFGHKPSSCIADGRWTYEFTEDRIDEIIWTSGATESDNLAIKGRRLSARIPAQSPMYCKCTSHLGFGLVALLGIGGHHDLGAPLHLFVEGVPDICVRLQLMELGLRQRQVYLRVWVSCPDLVHLGKNAQLFRVQGDPHWVGHIGGRVLEPVFGIRHSCLSCISWARMTMRKRLGPPESPRRDETPPEFRASRCTGRSV